MKKLYFAVILFILLYPKISVVAEGIQDELGWINDTGYVSQAEYESYFFVPWGEDRFGDFYILNKGDGLIYHPATASYWFMYGESEDSLYMYGPTTAGWVWTSRHYFPWIYFFDPITDIIAPGWGYIDYIQVRPDDEVWALMIFPQTSSGFRKRIILPF